MKKSLMVFVILLFLVQACASPTPTPTSIPTEEVPTEVVVEAPVQDTASRLEELGAYQCPDSNFTCVDVTVPLNHFDVSDTRTIDVVFGVLPASGESKGMFVVVVGGPGGSGLLTADSYAPYYDASILENFDLVFFDQRGINLSNGIYCPEATVEFYRADTDATTPEGEENLKEVTKTFVDDCINEIGETDLLPYLDTVQAAEDLEAFRALMGDEQFWLYGESYGTQFAQTYATAHPERVAGLILDGVVDLTLTDIDFLKGQAAAFNDVLVATLEACNADEFCAEDMGGDAVAVYDQLASQLKEAPISFEYPLSNGEVEQRQFTFSDLESIAGFLYSETPRLIVLRALAAYARDNTVVPLARVAYNALYVDPDTFAPVIDPSYSDAMYYGVTCRDYAEPGTTPEEQADNFIAAGDEVDNGLPRFASVFYGDMPCIYWPYPQEDDARPAPFVGEGIPTLVLNGTTDPATPYSNAESVYSNLADGYFITETGGPHVIFAWGKECIDTIVTDFLVSDIMPAEREITCEGIVAEEFVPVPLANAVDYDNPLDLLYDVENEIYYLPEYYYSSSTSATGIGCPYGGTLAFDADDANDLFIFTDCAFSAGFQMTGTGASNYEDGSFTIDITVSGLKEGTLLYVRDSEGTIQVIGSYGGEEINLSE